MRRDLTSVKARLGGQPRSEEATSDIGDTIQKSVRRRLADRLRAPDRETGPLDAISRLVDGTILLFDKERIFRMRDNERDDGNQFSPARRSERFTLAFVDTEIGVEDEAGNKQNFTYKEPGLNGILIPKSAAVGSDMREHLVDKLAIALRADPRPDAVMYPEFALPPVDVDEYTSSTGYDAFNSDDQRLIDRQFEDSAATMLKDACERVGCTAEEVPFIFYGSMHCRMSRYNIGVVSPGAPFENDFKLVRERGSPFTEVELVTDYQRHSGPIVHKKRFPARRAGEESRVPGDLGFRLYPSKIGFIAVLICSDAIDINQVFYIVRHNENADRARNFDRIGLVIVPAYTRSDLLHSSARDLSDLAQTTVFVGNAFGKLPTKNDLHKSKFPDPALYQSGKDESELCDLGVVDVRRARGLRYYVFAAAAPFQ